jgi:hypothetical protein
MKFSLLFIFLTCFSSHLLSEEIYYCSGQATMCVRNINGIWRADICDSGKYIFEFSDDFTSLTYKKRVRDKKGKNHKITEHLKCKIVDDVSPKRNRQLLSQSNGRITCIDFDGSQLGIPEVLDEVIHFSSNKDRFSIYPMHSNSYLMNGTQTDFVTFGTCSQSP